MNGRKAADARVVGDSSRDRVQRFKELADAYSDFLKPEGIRSRPYEDVSVPLFARASAKVQSNALQFLESAIRNFVELKSEGKDLRDNRALVWRALNGLKFIPDSQIFEKIDANDVIEICSLPDHFHLAWNLRLMESVSLTIEQLLCLPWWELWSRPPRVVESLMGFAARLANEELTTTFTPDIPVHKIREIQSADLLEIEITIKHVSPLRQDGRNAGYIIVSTNRMP